MAGGAHTKKKHRVVRICLGFILFLFVTMTVLTIVSPVPVALLVRLAFSRGAAVAPASYADRQAQVTVVKDVVYPSQFRDNVADIFFPAQKESPSPVVLWIHGGAFVGGSKQDVEVYATALASEGFAVVCINYQRAPEATYPAPLIQTQEAYLWLKELEKIYPLDADRIVLAGDSAGAHIAAQFAAIQTNGVYAGEMGFAPIPPSPGIKALLLFCAPFDVGEMAKMKYPAMFFVDRTAWAYFGTKDWAERFSDEATIANHVTAAFPPSFISDGNTASFEAQGRAFAEALKEKRVPVETYFIPLEVEKTLHEYQFQMDTPAGMEAFQRAVAFLTAHTSSE